jgi:hypothetical protein
MRGGAAVALSALCVWDFRRPVEIIEVSEDLIRLTPELWVEMPRQRIPLQAGPQFGSR